MFRDKVIEHTISAFEGGFSNRKNDRGGITNWGITKGFWADMDRIPVSSITDKMIRDLPREKAVRLYQIYWGRCRVDEIPESIQHFYFDMCVNHGPGNACSILQRAINSLGIILGIDGQLGPRTLKAAHDVPEQPLLKQLVKSRIEFYTRIVTRDPDQKENYKGWINRAEWFLSHTLEDE